MPCVVVILVAQARIARSHLQHLMALNAFRSMSSIIHAFFFMWGKPLGMQTKSLGMKVSIISACPLPATTTTTVLRLSGFCLGQPGWAGTRRNVHPLTPIVVISIPYLLPPSITIHASSFFNLPVLLVLPGPALFSYSLIHQMATSFHRHVMYWQALHSSSPESKQT